MWQIYKTLHPCKDGACATADHHHPETMPAAGICTPLPMPIPLKGVYHSDCSPTKALPPMHQVESFASTWTYIISQIRTFLHVLSMLPSKLQEGWRRDGT